MFNENVLALQLAGLIFVTLPKETQQKRKASRDEIHKSRKLCEAKDFRMDGIYILFFNTGDLRKNAQIFALKL